MTENKKKENGNKMRDWDISKAKDIKGMFKGGWTLLSREWRLKTETKKYR